MIKYIHEKYDNHFNIGVAGYPEGHPEEEDEQETLRYLKEKCDAGLISLSLKCFMMLIIFISWCSKLRKIGVDIPIIPGIMPISTYAAFIRRAKWSKIAIPQHFLDALDPIKDDDFLVRERGTELVSEICNKLLQSGYVNHLHFTL